MNLKEFFIDEKVIYPFKLFGKTHLFLLFLIIICLLIIFKNKNKLYKLNSQNKRNITISMAIIFTLNMLILYISSIYYHCFNFNTMLPLHLCYLSNYFYIYTILFKREHLLKYCYFLGFLGPLPAIIFFDVPSVFESYNFYLYIISHHLFLLGTVITFYFYPQKITFKDLIKLFLVLNICYFLMNIFNFYFNTNYFFTKGIPQFILELIPFLKFIPFMIILEIMEILIMVIIYRFWRKEYIHLLK